MSQNTFLPDVVREALTTLLQQTKTATNFGDIKNGYNIRDERYQALRTLAKNGDPSAIRLLDMMQATYLQADSANTRDFHAFKSELTKVFDPKPGGLFESLATVDSHAYDQHGEPKKEAPIINGGVLASAVKSLEVTLKQIANEGKTLQGYENARMWKGRLIGPVLAAGLGRKAWDALEGGDFLEAANAGAQAALITATQLEWLKPGVRALSKTAAGKAAALAGEKVAGYIGLQSTLTIAGRDIPIVGIIVSETGTLIGVAGRLANGDYAGAAGTFIAGTSGNVVAELIPIPGLDLLGGEAMEELTARGINYAFDPKVQVKGSSVLAAVKKIFGENTQCVPKPLPMRDAYGAPIFHRDEMLKLAMPSDGLRVAARKENLLSKEQPSFITKDEQAYLDSVARKLKHDPEVDKIIATLTDVFQRTKGNDMFLKGDGLDTALKKQGRNVNTASWTRWD